MIELKNVFVDYGRTPTLKDISFTAESGKITVLLGKNGSGKTTLLRAIAGSVPYRGSVAVDGAESASLSYGERAKRLAIMPQLLHSPPITVRELVAFGRQPYTGITGVLSKTDREIVESVLQKTELTALADKKLNRISGGERQKAYFALLLCQSTQNLLLDEPVSHLDVAYGNSLMTFLREERESGKAIVAVLHDINRALDIADKIIVLRSGEVFFEGDKTAFCEGTVAEQAFGLKKYLCSDPCDREQPGYFYK